MGLFGDIFGWYYGKNLHAARQDFLAMRSLQVLASGDRERSEFEAAFRKAYDDTKGFCDRVRPRKMTIANISTFANRMLEYLNRCVRSLEEYRTGNTPTSIGTCFGTFLVLFQYGIATKEFNVHDFADELNSKIQDFSHTLHRIHAKACCKHIASRLLAISKENREERPYGSFDHSASVIAMELS